MVSLRQHVVPPVRTRLLSWRYSFSMGLIPDTQTCGLRMRRECRERFPHHRFQRKPRVSDHGVHHGTCPTHVPWCMSGSLTHGGGENVSGACATRNFACLLRGPWRLWCGLNRLGLFVHMILIVFCFQHTFLFLFDQNNLYFTYTCMDIL